ncbi:MAG: peptidyl-prolyl cis-trans isomerase [Rhodobacteraceae bacterium]|nr:peptidyl-prolyl cis-trans isomerase [Paracoccaceae bacterium]
MTEKEPGFLRKFLRDPLIHFFAAGACIYLAYYIVAEPEVVADDKTVTVTTGEVEWLATVWESRWNRPPTQKELDGIVHQQVRETILYREALKMGLDKDDIVIRRRLAQKVEFLTQDLLQPKAPDEEQLTAYFEENIEDYMPEPRITFTQVFFDPDRRGNATLDDAEAAKAILSEMTEVPTNPDQFGDSFLLQGYYPDKTKFEISRLFGKGFSDPLFELEEGAWIGPVLSGYGTHLVYVHSRVDLQAPDIDTVREQLTANWIDLKRQELNDEFLARLMDSYTIIIEPAPDVKITTGGS